MTSKNKSKNTYDDGNIPEIDLPQNTQEFCPPEGDWITEPLPESERPRKDGPGGDGENHV